MSLLSRTFSLRNVFPAIHLNAFSKRHAGHNKWSKIRHKKGINDAKRAVIVSRFTREVISAVKASKNMDPAENPRLAALFTKARTLSIPKSNVESAMKKAQGAESSNMSEALYEATAYGASVLLEVVTDNTNRTLGLIRMVFNRSGGGIANVQYMFQRKGVITCQAADADRFFEEALHLGAEDVEMVGEQEHTVLTPFTCMYRIADELKQRGYPIQQVEPTYVCDEAFSMQLSGEKKDSFEKLLDTLNDMEDIVRVHHNVENVDDDR